MRIRPISRIFNRKFRLTLDERSAIKVKTWVYLIQEKSLQTEVDRPPNDNIGKSQKG